MAETRLQAAYRRRLDQIRARTLRLVIAADTPSTSAFVDRAVPVVLASQEATVAVVDAYMSAEAGLETGTSTDPWGLDPAMLIGVRARRGDFLENVYGRNHRSPASTFVERMAREVNTDITLADRAATYVHTEGDTRITGYRRVLSAGKNCALCIVASDRLYRKADLRPIHLRCKCTTKAIYDATNPKQWAKPSPAVLKTLYEKAGGTDAGSLIRIRARDLPDVKVIDSDLGPTLVVA